MSLMAMSAPRSSVFTFESTLHSCHVLRCLDEQRCRDVLCDVTVVVQGQSFRAHSSVLASCSEYFAQRISSSLTRHGAVIILPQEVTVAGFEPLLKFAYTSKLHLGKDNALAIRNSASILGLRDLDEACFDFLLPKFLNKAQKKRCKSQLSKEKCGTDTDDVFLDEKEVKPAADSPPPQEVAWDCNKSVKNKMGSQNSTDTVTPVAEGTKEHFVQCPKYRKFQLACGKEACVPEKNLAAPVKATRGDSVLSCSSRANSKNETEVEKSEMSNACRQSKGVADDPQIAEIYVRETENCVGRMEVDMVKKDTNERQGKRDEKVRENSAAKMEEEMKLPSGIRSSDITSVKAVSSEPSARLSEMSAGLILHHCPWRALNEGPAITSSLEHERFAVDFKEDKKAEDPDLPVPFHRKAEEEKELGGKGANKAWQRGQRGQTGTMKGATLSLNTTRESEAVEHMNFQESEAGCSADTGGRWTQSTSSDWLNLSSTKTSCPFLQDLDQRKCLPRLSECEGASQSGLSSLNSGEDGDSGTETEGDSEASTRERARQMQLPYSVDWIVDLSRNDFQQLLKQQVFTREQLDFVHDMRRRSKNRLAAQRCRKRKLDCIYNLQCEINKLRTEREKLIVEKSQLSQLKMKTCHSVSALCQKVCNEANLQPEQLQVLAKYTSPDCPMSSLFSHIDTLLSQHGMPLQPQGSLSACSVDLDKYMASEEAPSSSGRNTLTGQHPL
uniref:BTB and CNC homology 1, basic leucine zipper transcription factor 1 b n=1 Tax=Amphiprion percula TaxID=161767 RepID=A0A3P8TYR4_AMPPE